MKKPKNFIEFGTGLGCTSFMAAQAFQENNFGKVYTLINKINYGICGLKTSTALSSASNALSYNWKSGTDDSFPVSLDIN